MEYKAVPFEVAAAQERAAHEAMLKSMQALRERILAADPEAVITPFLWDEIVIECRAENRERVMQALVEWPHGV